MFLILPWLAYVLDRPIEEVKREVNRDGTDTGRVFTPEYESIQHASDHRNAVWSGFIVSRIVNIAEGFLIN